MFKQSIWLIAITICVISLLALGLATIGSIIYFLYLWGGTGVTIGAAAWGGAKAWLMTIAIGVPTALVSYITARATE